MTRRALASRHQVVIKSSVCLNFHYQNPVLYKQQKMQFNALSFTLMTTDVADFPTKKNPIPALDAMGLPLVYGLKSKAHLFGCIPDNEVKRNCTTN